MALTIIGDLSGLQRGVETAESGIGVTLFECRYFPKVNEEHLDNLGEVDGRVVSSEPSRELTIEGETTGSGGVLSATFIAAFSPANDVDTWGGTGDFYMQEATETQGRADWRKVRCRFLSDPTLGGGS